MAKEKYFAKFLRSLRIQRGISNISEYLKRFEVDSISEMYYRDLEAGRKTLSLERAPALCKQLKTDPRLFYFYLLRDSLGEDVLKSFVQPVVEEIYESTEARQKELESDKAMLRRALEKTFLVGSMHTTEKMIDYFDQNKELVRLVDFLFGLKTTTDSELKAVMRRCQIDRDLDSVITDFANLGLITVKEENGRKIISKNAPELHFDYGQSDAGKRLRLYANTSEFEQSLKQPKLSIPFEADEGAFTHAGVTVLPKNAYKKISDRLVDLIAEMHGASESLEAGARPFRFCFQIASRNEFLPVKNR